MRTRVAIFLFGVSAGFLAVAAAAAGFVRRWGP